MPRLARVIAPGFPHHVTQRGNRRQETFFNQDDYQAYVDLLAEQCRLNKVQLWGWCLMPNHVHLILVPLRAEGLRLALGKTHLHYSRRVNFRQGWRGHLWQGRFASFPMEEAHLWQAARYIDLNPVRAGLVERPEEWPWSSARSRILGATDPLLSPHCPILGTRETRDWSAFLTSGLAPETRDLFQCHERTGRPLGSATFIGQLEKILGRELALKKAGRKPKSAGT